MIFCHKIAKRVEDQLLREGEYFTYTESALSLDSLVGRLVHGDALSDE